MAPATLLPMVPLLPLVAPLKNAAAAAGPAVKGKVLVVFFSRSGNTRVIAGQLRRTFEAPLFEIEPATPYPEDYLQTVEQARRERDAGVRPALKAKVANLAQYQTIFFGFPIWGETAPPVIRSFLSTHDLAGKTIIPFITHGGYGTGNSLSVLAAHASGVTIADGALVMQADQERATMDRVNQWLAIAAHPTNKAGT